MTMEWPRTDVPLGVLIFVLVTWGVTGVLCLVNWYRRRGAGVAFLETLRFVTMGLILFTLCKPEYDRELPRQEDKEIDVVILADRSGSMATEDVDLGSGQLLTREQLLNARLGGLGALTRDEGNGARILKVYKPSPAQMAGLKAGDLLVGIDGNSTSGGLGSLLAEYESGAEVKLQVRREGKLIEPAPAARLLGLAELIEEGFKTNGISANVYLKEFDRPSPEANGTRPSTDINAAIVHETTEYDNLRAMLLLSDGDRTEGKAPTEEAARLLRDNRVVLHTVTNLGSLTYPADVELELLDVPSFGVIDDRVAIPFRIRNHLTRGITTNVFLANVRGKTVDSRQIEVDARGEATGSFIWPATREGNQTFEVRVPIAPEEFNQTNNFERFSIHVRPNTNNVLIIESRPRWEYRYLRNALTRAEDVDVRALLLHPGMPQQTWNGSNGYLEAFPPMIRPKELRGLPDPGPVSLADFDVIFLGDVGLGPGGLSEEQADQIRALVEHQSAGLVFMPGALGRQLSFYRWKKHTVANTGSETRESIANEHGVAPRTLEYANPSVDWDDLKPGRSLFVPHPLADLLPVVYDTRMPMGDWTRAESRFSLLPEGRVSPLLLLEEDEFLNDELWRRALPGFFWHAGVLRDAPLPGSQILAIHSTKRNQYGFLPLLVTAQAGNGHVLFMGTDSAWRWRRGVEDRYHYAFWGQVVRWMGHKRKLAIGKGMRLILTPERPGLKETVKLEAIIGDRAGVGGQDRVVADITRPDGTVVTGVEFRPVEGSFGTYTADFKMELAGDYLLHTYTPDQVKIVDGRREYLREVKKVLRVEDEVIEIVGRPIKHAVLTQLARDTRGDTHALADLTPFLQRITERSRYTPEVEVYELWADPWWGGLILLLLAIYWTMRKVIGLV
ncbi:MAG: hypothetical protein CMO66_05665 [Verrucomicrobiales bacterium]|nr:hypothetical protein [Verrucomicrobiales bacterium]